MSVTLGGGKRQGLTPLMGADERFERATVPDR